MQSASLCQAQGINSCWVEMEALRSFISPSPFSLPFDSRLTPCLLPTVRLTEAAGLVKSIGVSNLQIADLEVLLSEAKVGKFESSSFSSFSRLVLVLIRR